MNKQKYDKKYLARAITSLLINLLLFLIVMIVPQFFSPTAGSGEFQLKWLLLGGGGLFLFSLIVTIISYYTVHFYEEDNSIILDRNFIFKKKVILPYSRITTINSKQTLLDKIFKIKTILLSSGSTMSSVQEEFKACVSIKHATNLETYFKERVRCAKNDILCTLTLPSSIDIVEANNIDDNKLNNTDEDNLKDRVKLKELFLAANLQSFSQMILSGLIVSSFTMPILAPILDNNNVTPTVGVFSLLILFFIVISYIITVGKYIIKYYNFNVYDDVNYIFIQCGLFTTRSYKIPKSKINGVVIQQTFIQKLTQNYTTKLVYVGSGIDTGEQITSCLFPNSKLNKLQDIINRYVPEYNIDIELTRPRASSKRFFYIARLVRLTIFTIGACVGSYFIPPYFGINVALIIAIIISLILYYFTILDAHYKYKYNGVAISDNKAIFSSNGIKHTTAIIKAQATQSLTKSSTVFRLPHKVFTYKVVVHGTITNNTFKVYGMHSDDIDSLEILKLK